MKFCRILRSYKLPEGGGKKEERKRAGGRLEYQGRASLGHGEELLTLSKGWINFYLLKDSVETDNTSDEGDTTFSFHHIFNDFRIFLFIVLGGVTCKFAIQIKS